MAETVTVWTGASSDASIIAYDTNPAPEGGQIAFFAWNYEAAGAARIDLLENAVLWLLTPEYGNCTVSGTMILEGQANHAGITVRAIPNGGEVLTGPDGAYQLPGLYAGAYSIQASKVGWTTEAVDVDLTDGQHLTDVDLVLQQVFELVECSQPNAPISENLPPTVDTINFAENEVVEAVEVYLDVSHTYIGDLTIDLTAPCGITVRLHDRAGGSTNDIVGWYPVDIEPAESLDILIGNPTQGDWELAIEDHAGGDQGMLNEWCVRLIYAGVVLIDEQPGEEENNLPTVFALHDNYPNPFNPMTTIKFDLPRQSQVSLRIYDVAGRLVRTLVDELKPAAAHSVVWNGQDNNGRQAASGVYYYQLVTDEFSKTSKMLLVK